MGLPLKYAEEQTIQMLFATHISLQLFFRERVIMVSQQKDGTGVQST